MLLAAALSTDPAAPAQIQFEMRHLEDKYRNQVLTMACTVVSLVDLRDSYTGGHSTRVAAPEKYGQTCGNPPAPVNIMRFYTTSFNARMRETRTPRRSYLPHPA